MIKKLKAERNILILCILTSLTFHIIFGLEADMQIASLEKSLQRRLAQMEAQEMLLEIQDLMIITQDELIQDYINKDTAELQAKIYDIPLSTELQEFTYKLCIENDLNYEMVLAIMDKESDYREEIISSTNDYGIMQINKVNHAWLADTLNIDNLLDAEQNILAGIYMLKDLKTKYEDPHKVLMAYNMGEYGAKKLWDQGIASSKYSRQVISIANELGGE